MLTIRWCAAWCPSRARRFRLRAWPQKNFDRRAAEYLAELDGLDKYCRDRAAELTAEQRVLITSHDAFHYFGRAYGFEVVGIQGISTDTEAGTMPFFEACKMYVPGRSTRNENAPSAFVVASTAPPLPFSCRVNAASVTGAPAVSRTVPLMVMAGRGGCCAVCATLNVLAAHGKTVSAIDSAVTRT